MAEQSNSNTSNVGAQTQPLMRRIVVGMDLTRTSDHALRQAAQIAQAFPSSELHIAYVLEAKGDIHDADKLDALSSELQSKLVELRERVEYVCRPEPGESSLSQEMIFHVRIGAPAEALHQVAIDVDADMLVVGTHGRRGVDKLLMGSVSEAVMRIAHLPVLIAHAKHLEGLPRSERPEPPRPGEELHGASATHRARIELPPRSSHISGLI